MASLAALAWVADIDDLKEFLGVSGSSKDSLLTNLTNRAYALLEEYLGREIVSQARTEYYDGTGDDILTLPQYPVTAVASLYDDSNHDYESISLISSDDIAIENQDQFPGRIRLYNNEVSFSAAKRAIKITYTAGYAQASVPAPLIEGLYIQIGGMLNKRRAFGILSHTLGGQSTSWERDGILKEVKDLIRSYRKFGGHVT